MSSIYKRSLMAEALKVVSKNKQQKLLMTLQRVTELKLAATLPVVRSGLPRQQVPLSQTNRKQLPKSTLRHWFMQSISSTGQDPITRLRQMLVVHVVDVTLVLALMKVDIWYLRYPINFFATLGLFRRTSLLKLSFGKTTKKRYPYDLQTWFLRVSCVSSLLKDPGFYCATSKPAYLSQFRVSTLRNKAKNTLS